MQHLFWNEATGTYMVSCSYPIIILNFEISSFVKKVIQYFDMVIFSCQVQRSHLIERKKVSQKSSHYYLRKLNWCTNYKNNITCTMFLSQQNA